MNTDKQAYWEKLKEFNSWRTAIFQRIATGEEVEYVALKKWLRKNFKPDYIDLF